MNSKPIRVVIRQPLHGLIQHWAELLGVDDFGEVVNFLLLDLKRTGYQPTNTTTNTKSEVTSLSKKASNEDSEISELAGIFGDGTF